MPHVIVYGNERDQDKIESILTNAEIDIVKLQGLSKYQEERAFIYGNKNYGHAIAVIYISGEEPIPFGVISADINNKKLPVIVYVANNDKARTIQADFFMFLEETNIQLKTHLKNCDSFHFNEANYSLIHEGSDDMSAQLIGAIQKVHTKYLEQPEKSRTVRTEAISPTEAELEEKKHLFSRMEGFSKMASSLEEFKSHLDKYRPTISFFGTIFPPLTDKCEWASTLGECNLIFGLGGADKNKPLEEQSVMYQFAYYAKNSGCNVYGTIPHGQVRWEESRDFSELDIKSCYITPQLQERMEAFKELSNLTIVGSTGTGTYEEVLDSLRTNPLTYLIIINNDGANTPLVTFLEKNKGLYPNCIEANTREEFSNAIKSFKWNYQKLNTFEEYSLSSRSSFYNSLSSSKESLTSPENTDVNKNSFSASN